MILISGTYEVVTPESAEQGDFAEHGFDFENEPFTFSELVRLMRTRQYPSQSPLRPADVNDYVWFSSEPETDYRDGSETTYAIHYSRDNDPRSLKYWLVRGSCSAGPKPPKFDQ